MLSILAQVADTVWQPLAGCRVGGDSLFYYFKKLSAQRDFFFFAALTRSIGNVKGIGIGIGQLENGMLAENFVITLHFCVALSLCKVAICALICSAFGLWTLLVDGIGMWMWMWMWAKSAG